MDKEKDNQRDEEVRRFEELTQKLAWIMGELKGVEDVVRVVVSEDPTCAVKVGRLLGCLPLWVSPEDTEALMVMWGFCLRKKVEEGYRVTVIFDGTVVKGLVKIADTVGLIGEGIGQSYVEQGHLYRTGWSGKMAGLLLVAREVYEQIGRPDQPADGTDPQVETEKGGD